MNTQWVQKKKKEQTKWLTIIAVVGLTQHGTQSRLYLSEHCRDHNRTYCNIWLSTRAVQAAITVKTAAAAVFIHASLTRWDFSRIIVCNCLKKAHIWVQSLRVETEKTHTYTGKKWNQKISTALAAAKEISVGAAAVTTTVLAKLDGSFTWNEAQKGTHGFFETKHSAVVRYLLCRTYLLLWS